MLGLQVAELAIKTGAAARHQVGRERGIALRRDVPVIRHAELDTTAIAEAHIRRQPARFALSTEREGQDRHRQNRHAIEAQHRPGRHTLIGLKIHVQLTSRNFPGQRRPIFVDRAAAVSAVQRLNTRRAAKSHLGRMTTAPGEREEVAGIEELPLKALEIELQFRPAE